MKNGLDKKRTQPMGREIAVIPIRRILMSKTQSR